MCAARGVMPIQTKGARAPLVFLSQWILHPTSKLNKRPLICYLICLICTILYILCCILVTFRRFSDSVLIMLHYFYSGGIWRRSQRSRRRPQRLGALTSSLLLLACCCIWLSEELKRVRNAHNISKPQYGNVQLTSSV